MLEVNFNPFPEITTERLLLRQVTTDDAGELFALRSHDEVMRYICRPRPKGMDDIQELIQKIRTNIATNEGIAWAMTLKGDRALIGHISFHVLQKENYRAEVGYMMHPDLQGKGIMDEALKAVLAYGFKTMGLHSVYGVVSPYNKASKKLLERNGFVQEAYFKEDTYWEGEFLDSEVWGKVSAE